MTRFRLTNVAAIMIALATFSSLAIAQSGGWENTTHTRVGVPPDATNNVIERLKKVEARVASVVSKNLSNCVAVTDGAGFGSGIVVSADGLVLTAGHVMASRGDNYEVIFPNGDRVPAKPLGRNLNFDAGMVQLLGEGPWKYSKLADEEPEVGDWVVSFGHSGGFDLGRSPPVRTGRVLRWRDEQIVTDAVLIGGDSGGPLFDLNGKVIGIHSSIGDSVAENRHMSIAIFKEHWKRLASGDNWGELPPLQKIGDEKKKQKRGKLGITVDKGVDNAQIVSVKPGSPAATVGLKVNDIVTEFDGTKVTSSKQLIALIKKKRAGDSCRITVKRNGVDYYFMLNLQEL